MKKDKLITKDGNMFTVFYLSEKQTVLPVEDVYGFSSPSLQPTIELYEGSDDDLQEMFPKPLKAKISDKEYTPEQKALQIWRKMARQI